jgi:hypothetical protein
MSGLSLQLLLLLVLPLAGWASSASDVRCRRRPASSYWSVTAGPDDGFAEPVDPTNTFYVSSSRGSPLSTGRGDPENPAQDLAATLQAAPANSRILLCEGDAFYVPASKLALQLSIKQENTTLSSYVCDPSRAGTRPVLTQGLNLDLYPSNMVVRGDVKPTPWDWAPVDDPAVKAKREQVNSLPLVIYDLSSFVTKYSDISFAWGVWMNGTRHVQARFPNLEHVTDPTGSNETEFIFLSSSTNTSLTPSAGKLKRILEKTSADQYYWTGATIRYRDTDWSYRRQIVTDVKPPDGSSKSLPTLLIGPGSVRVLFGLPGFYLEHGLEELDHPGEFYYNPQSGLLYVIPASAAAAGGSPSAPASAPSPGSSSWAVLGRPPISSYFQEINLVAGVSVTLTVLAPGAVISDIEFSHSFNGLQITSVGSVIVRSRFLNHLARAVAYSPPTSGIRFDTSLYPWHAHGIFNSSVDGADVRGVQAFNNSGGPMLWVRQSVFTNIGLVAGYAAQPFGLAGSVYVGDCAFVLMGYGAIMPMANSMLTSSELRDVMLTSSDGGAVYGVGPLAVNVTVTNIVVRGVYPNSISSYSSSAKGRALYADDASSLWTFENNVVELRPPAWRQAVLLHGSEASAVSSSPSMRAFSAHARSFARAYSSHERLHRRLDQVGPGSIQDWYSVFPDDHSAGPSSGVLRELMGYDQSDVSSYEADVSGGNVTQTAGDSLVDPSSQVFVLHGIYIHNSHSNVVRNNTLLGSPMGISHDSNANNAFGVWSDPRNNTVVDNRFLQGFLPLCPQIDALIEVRFANGVPTPGPFAAVVFADFGRNLFARNASISGWNPVVGVNVSTADQTLLAQNP